jgi:biopolymer transport protein ExbB
MEKMWEMISQAWLIMIPLLMISVLSLAVVIERAFYLRRNRILKPELVWTLDHLQKIEDLEQVMDKNPRYSGPFINIIRVCLDNRQRSREEVKEAIVDQGRQEARTLERGLGVLETVAGIAPLMGLLGTVLGMIRVFDVISRQGLGQTQSLSGGISEALITTVAGLSIAIPTLVAYNYFTHKVEDLVLEIEKYSAQILNKVK